MVYIVCYVNIEFTVDVISKCVGGGAVNCVVHNTQCVVCIV